jgi:uncharacterized membrane protein YfcA
MDNLFILLIPTAILIGFTIGLLGGGGSILAVPVFVYLMHIEPHNATSYSLFVVGISSLLATLQNLNKNLIKFKVGLLFGLPVFIVIFCVRKFLLPLLPEMIYKGSSFDINQATALMLLFGLVMLAASISMIIGRKENNDSSEKEGAKVKSKKYFLIILQGIFVGLITGLVGAGGGFLIIPALVILTRMEMKNAIATSLFIITINSIIGFSGDIGNVIIDWSFLSLFALISLAGVVLGLFANSKIDNEKLRKIFGYFVLVMGIFILVKEIFLA